MSNAMPPRFARTWNACAPCAKPNRPKTSRPRRRIRSPRQRPSARSPFRNNALKRDAGRTFAGHPCPGLRSSATCLRQAPMHAAVREFIDFWIENSIHAAEHGGDAGATQNVDELVRRCVDMAADQGFTEAELRAEVGDIDAYI